jgi:prepilin peptidase CpaA
MMWLVLYLFSVLAALGMGLFAAWSDFRGMQIPNIVHAVIVLSFIPAYAAAHYAGVKMFAPPGSHAAAAGLVLAITFGMFAMRALGGGDAKLLSAYALWTAFSGLIFLLFYMALSGAFVALATVVIRKRKPFKNPRVGGWIARAQAGENGVPYGIPIVIGAFVAFFMQGYLAPHKLVLFVGG